MYHGDRESKMDINLIISIFPILKILVGPISIVTYEFVKL